MTEPILEVRGLCVEYGNGEKPVRAVDGVGLTLTPGRVLALVGESGCGKTTTALALLGLLPYAGRVTAGDVRLEGRDLRGLSDDELRRVRGREISMIFEDPVTGLNPVLSVGDQVAEIITAHTDATKEEAGVLVEDALRRVGLSDPAGLAKRFPYQLSGGISQRVLIAIATVLNPKVLIADEPTSALDVTVQAGILRELDILRHERGVAILLITHDLGVVAQLADDVVVMYAGRVAERGATRDVLRRPRHPYTWALLETLPRIDMDRRPLTSIKGAPPDLSELPEECAFLPRCRKATMTCRTMPSPALTEQGPGQLAACYNPVFHQE